MKKKKKKILIILISVIILLLVLVSSLYLLNRNNSTNNNQNIYEKMLGTWYIEYVDTYSGGMAGSYTGEDGTDYIEIYDDGNINICYMYEGERECQKCNYSFNKNKIIIGENDTFLSGEREVIIKDEKLTLKKEYSKGVYSELHFGR